MIPAPTTQDAGGDAWANAQVQQALSVLLPDVNSDWFEDHSDSFREWLARKSRQHLDEALSHRRLAHSMRRDGHPDLFRKWMREAIREIRLSKHFGKEMS